MILEHFWVHKGGGSTKPTAPVMYMVSLRMFTVFFDFIVSIFWYTITMKIEYDYKESLNMTKLSQIDRIHVLVKGLNQK